MIDDYTKLEKLNDLKQKGIITEEEFNTKKQEILGNKNHQPEPQKTTLTQSQDSTSLKSTSETPNQHYMKVYAKFDALINEYQSTKKTPSLKQYWSWNWAAFLLGVFWSLYKKLWGWVMIWIFLMILALPAGLFPIFPVLHFAQSLWADFYMYHRYKTGHTVFFRSPKKMFLEIAGN